MKKLNQVGSHVIAIVLAVVVVGIVGLVGWRVMSSGKTKNSSQSSSTTPQTNQAETASAVSWSFNGSAWTASGTPPSCPNPLKLKSPVDVSKASAVLYPGQYRGNNYKAHGGFIFRGQANDAITVTVPIDSVVFKGSRYIEQGETQYFFVFIAPCGIMYRFDHLLTLSADFQKIADTLPAAKVDDSSTTNFNPAPSVKAGDVVATAVGFKKTGNVSVDFGVYDIRQKNQASSDGTWKTKHPNDIEFGTYAVCWFDLLPDNDAAAVKALPAGDQSSGKTSDYCK